MAASLKVILLYYTTLQGLRSAMLYLGPSSLIVGSESCFQDYGTQTVCSPLSSMQFRFLRDEDEDSRNLRAKFRYDWKRTCPWVNKEAGRVNVQASNEVWGYVLDVCLCLSFFSFHKNVVFIFASKILSSFTDLKKRMNVFFPNELSTLSYRVLLYQLHPF